MASAGAVLTAQMVVEARKLGPLPPARFGLLLSGYVSLARFHGAQVSLRHEWLHKTSSVPMLSALKGLGNGPLTSATTTDRGDPDAFRPCIPRI